MVLHGIPKGKLDKRIVTLADVGIGPGTLGSHLLISWPFIWDAPQGLGRNPSVQV